MRAEYDFARMKGGRNPYARRLKRSVTMRLDDATIAYFKELAADTGVPYQSLINLYLRDCVRHRRRPAQNWVSDEERPAAGTPRAPALADVRADAESGADEFRVSDKSSSRARRRPRAR
jgi:antitoxin component of RelBE/YafQ-DinJ toxin-antitoxin module